MKPIWLLAIAFMVTFLVGIFSRKLLLRKCAAVVLFLVIAIGATLFFEASVRIVLDNAYQSKEISDGFVLGVRRLSGWFTWSRIVVVIAALGLMIIALRKPPT